MAELRAETRSVHEVLATPAGCDAVAGRGATCRLSPGEVMLVGELDTAELRSAVRTADPDALVAEVTDAWVAFVLEGPDARDAFARLSELELPAEGAVAGEVARIGVRVLAGAGGLTLLVPAMLADHLEERIRTDCAELLG